MNDRVFDMGDSFYSHEAIAWVKHRLDELDAIILEVEKSIAEQSGAVTALERLKAARVTFQNQYDTLRADATELKQKAKSIEDALAKDWTEVETSIRSVLTATADQAALYAASWPRADARRGSWEASLAGFRAEATEAMDRARQDLDSLMRRLSEEAAKFQTRIGDAKDAGDESWAAVKGELSEAKEVHDRTLEKIKTSISKLF